MIAVSEISELRETRTGATKHGHIYLAPRSAFPILHPSSKLLQVLPTDMM